MVRNKRLSKLWSPFIPQLSKLFPLKAVWFADRTEAGRRRTGYYLAATPHDVAEANAIFLGRNEKRAELVLHAIMSSPVACKGCGYKPKGREAHNDLR